MPALYHCLRHPRTVSDTCALWRQFWSKAHPVSLSRASRKTDFPTKMIWSCMKFRTSETSPVPVSLQGARAGPFTLEREKVQQGQIVRSDAWSSANRSNKGTQSLTLARPFPIVCKGSTLSTEWNCHAWVPSLACSLTRGSHRICFWASKKDAYH